MAHVRAERGSFILIEVHPERRKALPKQDKRLLRSNLLDRLFGSAEVRRRANFQRIMRLARANGVEVYRGNLIWPHDATLVDAKKRDIRGIPNDRCFTLLEVARKTRTVAGDIAECGVRYGRSSYFIMKGTAGAAKNLYLFDSFEGLSKPSSADQVDGAGSYWQQGDLSAPEQVVQENLREFPNVFVLKGWIPDRFSDVADRRFSLVHIDVDLYEPTLESLRFFYPRMSAGGVIVCDDYGFKDCPGAKRAFDEFFRDKPNMLLMLTTGQCIVVC